LVEAKKSLAAGINPALQKKSLQESEKIERLNTFEVVARE
jgi:hypothetical protein